MRKANKILSGFVILGDAIYFFWILYNGINEGFSGTPVEIVSATGMLFLLILNIFVICRKK